MQLGYDSRESTRRRVEMRLALLVVLAMTLRLAWVLQLSRDPASLANLPDQIGYLELGRNLLTNHTLVYVDPRFAQNMLAARMPGYPIFVALCQGEIEIVRIVQVMIDAGTVLGVYALSRRWLDRGPSTLAAAVVAVNPFLIYFCGLLLSETLFTAMLVWGMALLVVRQPYRRSWQFLHPFAWLAGAVLLALSILVRPSAIGLPVVLGFGSAFVNRSQKIPTDWRWSPPVGALMLVLTVMVLFPWAYRNEVALGRWLWGTSNDGITLYDGLNPAATGASDQSFVHLMPQLKNLTELQRNDYLSNEAWTFVREEPVSVLQLAGWKMLRFWSPVPLSTEFGGNWKILAVALIYMIPLNLLAIVGLWFGKANRAAKLFLFLPALYFTLVHAITIGSLRYRLPADVPIAILAAMGAELASIRRTSRVDDSQAVPVPD